MRIRDKLRDKLSDIGEFICAIYKFVIDMIYPRRCPVCDDPAPLGRMICPECEGKLKFIRQPFCFKCGKQLDSEEKELCNNCGRQNHLYTKGRALYQYQTVNQSIYRFKFGGRMEYASYYGDMISEKLGPEIVSWKPDVIVPVPLHRSKAGKRGYNQADLLGKVIAHNLDIPYKTDLILRQKKTVPLKELSSSMRQINLKNAFIVRHNDVKLNTVVIVDDIYTTGSTINEMTRSLKSAGVEKVYFIALSIGAGI